MLDTIFPLLAFLFFVVGTALLYDGVSASDFAQMAKTIGGASFLSLGLVSLWISVKNWWKGRTVYKEYRRD
jgi:uncharacterized membrane protein